MAPVKKAKLGRPVTVGDTVPVLLRLPEHLARAVSAAAHAEKIRVTEWLRRAAQERAERQARE